MKAHLIDCTYCVYRWITPGDKKRNIREIERCRISTTPIPAPSEPGRFCEQFKQIGHDCASCYS